MAISLAFNTVFQLLWTNPSDIKLSKKTVDDGSAKKLHPNDVSHFKKSLGSKRDIDWSSPLQLAFATRLLPEASRTSLFGPSSAPAFATPLLPEASRTSLFGPSSSPAFTTGLRPEASSTSLFGPSSAPSFATILVSDPSRTSVFGPSSAPSFATGLLPQPSRTSVFGPSNSKGFAIGLQPEPSRTFAFGPSTAPTFATGLLPEPLAGQTTRLANGCPSFEQSAFRVLRGGTRVTTYVPTAEMKGFYGENSKNSEILKSISAMPFYQEKSHEELKWEDYQLRDRDVGLNPVIQSTAESGIRAVVTPSKPLNKWHIEKQPFN